MTAAQARLICEEINRWMGLDARMYRNDTGTYDVIAARPDPAQPHQKIRECLVTFNQACLWITDHASTRTPAINYIAPLAPAELHLYNSVYALVEARQGKILNDTRTRTCICGAPTITEHARCYDCALEEVLANLPDRYTRAAAAKVYDRPYNATDYCAWTSRDNG